MSSKASAVIKGIAFTAFVQFHSLAFRPTSQSNRAPKCGSFHNFEATYLPRSSVLTQSALYEKDRLLLDDAFIESTTRTRREWFRQTAASTSAVIASTLQRPTTAYAAVSTPARTLASPQAIVKQAKVATKKAVCDPAVTSWMKEKRVIHILGTAHISQTSAVLAGRLVREIKPQAVFVELDRKRVARAVPPKAGVAGGRLQQQSRLGAALRPRADSDSTFLSYVTGRLHGTRIPLEMTTAFGSPWQSNDDMSTAAAAIVNAGGQSLASGAILEYVFNNPFVDARERMMRASTNAVGGALKGFYNRLDSAGFSAGEEVRRCMYCVLLLFPEFTRLLDVQLIMVTCSAFYTHVEQFTVAVREGLNIGSTIVLGDRDVDITLRRLTQALGKTDVRKFLSVDAEMERRLPSDLPESLTKQAQSVATTGAQGTDAILGDLNANQIRDFVEVLKTRENVRNIMSVLKDAAPEVYKAMVEERDEYMGNGLNRLTQFASIVAVMGIAHTDGVETYLQRSGWKAMVAMC